MGVYDDYGDGNLWVQLKVGPCELHEYRVGDAVDIADGVYLDHAGVVVVLEGRLAAVFSHLCSKWGDVIGPAVAIYLNKAGLPVSPYIEPGTYYKTLEASDKVHNLIETNIKNPPPKRMSQDSSICPMAGPLC